MIGVSSLSQDQYIDYLCADTCFQNDRRLVAYIVDRDAMRSRIPCRQYPTPREKGTTGTVFLHYSNYYSNHTPPENKIDKDNTDSFPPSSRPGIHFNQFLENVSVAWVILGQLDNLCSTLAL